MPLLATVVSELKHLVQSGPCQIPSSREKTGQFTWVNRYFWHGKAEPEQLALGSPFIRGKHLTLSLLVDKFLISVSAREVESRKGEEPQSKKANPSENLDHFLLFLGLVFLCLTCCMSTTVSAIIEKKRNFSLNKHLRATAMKRPWEVGRWRRPACSALPRVANWEWLALRKGFVFLGEDEGQLSINLCKLRNEAVPSDSPRAFGLRRISWDVSSCVSFQPLQNGDSS